MLCPRLPYQQTPKYPPAPSAGLRCRPLQAKDSGLHKISLHFGISLYGRAWLTRQSLVLPQGPSGGAEPHPYYGPRKNAHEIWRISWFHSRGGAFDFFDYYCAGGGTASGKAELTGEGHDAEEQQKRRPQKEVETAENRLSGAVFRNVVGLVGIVIAHHLPPQILLAGKGLAA